MKKSKILLVDDNPLHRTLLRDELEDAQYGIEMVKDIAEAREILKTFKPDLFVLDIVLRGEKFEVIKWVQDELRSSKEFDDTPILFVTAYRREMDEHVRNIQRTRVLGKPFTYEEIGGEIRLMLSGKFE